MGTYLDAVITGLAVLLICTVVFLYLQLKHARDRREWEKLAEENYLLGKGEFSEFLRETCDRIAEDTDALAHRSDRELLLQILLTLGSYERRMDRMEDKLRIISHYRSYTADMTDKAQKLNKSFLLLESDVAEASATLNSLQHSITETRTAIDTLVDMLAGMGPLQQAVNSYAAQLGPISTTLEYLQAKTASIASQMDDVMTVHDQSSAKRLKTVEMEITGLSLLINSLNDSVSELSDTAREIRPGSKDPEVLQKLDEMADTLRALQKDAAAAKKTDN